MQVRESRDRVRQPIGVEPRTGAVARQRGNVLRGANPGIAQRGDHGSELVLVHPVVAAVELLAARIGDHHELRMTRGERLRGHVERRRVQGTHPLDRQGPCKAQGAAGHKSRAQTRERSGTGAHENGVQVGAGEARLRHEVVHGGSQGLGVGSGVDGVEPAQDLTVPGQCHGRDRRGIQTQHKHPNSLSPAPQPLRAPATARRHHSGLRPPLAPALRGEVTTGGGPPNGVRSRARSPRAVHR